MKRAQKHKLMVANWKMHKTGSECIRYIMELKSIVSEPWCELAIAPPHTALHSAQIALAQTPFLLAAQNMHYESTGAYTGEISPGMLIDLDCAYVVLGHSERRQYFLESDETVNKKVLAAFEYGLRPVVCVGESLQDREKGETLPFIRGQVKNAMRGVNEVYAKDLVIAYEPIWAIGTGKAASVADIVQVHQEIRVILEDLLGKGTAQELRIIYGGSVNPKNIHSLMEQSEIDGALVGSASLDAETFASLIINGEL